MKKTVWVLHQKKEKFFSCFIMQIFKKMHKKPSVQLKMLSSVQEINIKKYIVAILHFVVL
jgi:hypothetical protein